MSEEPQQQQQQRQQLSPTEVFIQLSLQSQQNITKLIGMQEQQMSYINAVFSKVIDEQKQLKTAASAGQSIDNGSESKEA
jgi:hypothetical protein